MMNRRHFLKESTLLTAGGLILPSMILTSCGEDIPFEGIQYDGKVLIVGAGAAGLYAAYTLNSYGIDFEVLEASSVYGGRLGKLTGFADFPLDLGAQWLHGRKNICGDLVRETGTKITLDDSEEKYWFNNQIVDSLPDNIEEIFQREDGLPDISFKDYAIQEGFGNEYTWIVEGIAGDSGASASRISTHWKIVEEENWSSGDEDFKFEETYFDLIDKEIASKVIDRIRLNTVVTQIDYSGDLIVVTDRNQQTYTANKIIIAVPITILKSSEIQFTPALPAEKTNAFSKIGMEAGMKVFLKFSKTFYEENVTGGSICAFYADERVGKKGNDHVLLAFVMGQQAEYLTSLGNDAAIVSALLQELDTMYDGDASASFISAHVHNLTTDPFIRGAYSYSTIGMGNARHIAAQQVEDKVFFAGEAMNTNGHHQTVFGAAETGYQEVIHIFETL